MSPEKLIVGMVQLTLGGRIAVPVRPTCCGLPLALSNTFSVAASAPVELGVNVTLIVQLLPAAIGVLHDGLVCEKSAAFVPKILMPVPPVMASAAVPVLVSVTVCAGEVVPFACGAKTSKVGLKLAMGAGAATVRERFAEKLRAGVAESVTVTLTEVVPAALGVPERTPVLALMVSHEGCPVTLQV
jgi:hypothetical protein